MAAASPQSASCRRSVVHHAHALTQQVETAWSPTEVSRIKTACQLALVGLEDFLYTCWAEAASPSDAVADAAGPAWDPELHLPLWISGSERRQIEARLPGFVQRLLDVRDPPNLHTTPGGLSRHTAWSQLSEVAWRVEPATEMETHTAREVLHKGNPRNEAYLMALVPW